jgi:L-lactate dehydrogenase (cytochrome)
MWSLEEVQRHNSADSCWIIIENNVYDVTEFLDSHPGGRDIILKYAGKDATLVYQPIHPKDALKDNLPASKHLGPVDSRTAAALDVFQQNRTKTKDELRVEKALKERPPLDHILNIAEIEVGRFLKKFTPQPIICSKLLAACCLIRPGLTIPLLQMMGFVGMMCCPLRSLKCCELANIENAHAFTRFFFNARVLRPVSHCDPSTTILGFRSSIPVFVSGAALAKLGHPLGTLH